MQGKKLSIIRTFRDDEGKVYNRIDIVKDPAIIEGYVRARQSTNLPVNDWELSGRGFKDWQHNAPSDAPVKKRKKPVNAAPPRKRPKTDKVLKLKCGACGQVGHMKSNKDCPYYQMTQAKMLSKKSTSQTKASIIGDQSMTNDSTAAGNGDSNVMIKFYENQVILSNQLVKK